MKLTPHPMETALCIKVEERRIDAASAVQFKETMRSLVSEENGRVLLDLSQVTFIDSSGLGALVAVMKNMPGQAKIELAGIQPIVQKVLALTKMDQVFVIHETCEAALSAAQPAA